MLTVVLWRYPPRQYASRYRMYVQRNYMHLRSADALPTLTDWIEANANDQTHDLLRGGAAALSRGMPDEQLMSLAVARLAPFNIVGVVEQLDTHAARGGVQRTEPSPLPVLCIQERRLWTRARPYTRRQRQPERGPHA